MVANGLSRPVVYKNPIYRLRIHMTMETYEVDEHGYPTAKGCYQIMRAILDRMPRPEFGTAEHTHWSNANYALGYIKSALDVSDE